MPPEEPTSVAKRIASHCSLFIAATACGVAQLSKVTFNVSLQLMKGIQTKLVFC